MISAKPLFLFDIDGTLVSRAGPQHRQALEAAASQAVGRTISSEGVPVAGNLDREILRLMLKQAGVGEKQIFRAMPAMFTHAQRLYRELCPDLRHRVCPGVRAFLGRLRRRGIAAGLVTGNLSRIGWHKVRRAGLRDYFEFGAFSDMGYTRAELAAKAIRQARKEGFAQQKSRVYLVGDHLNDIRAARANRISIISVTTGPMTREELAAYSPDFLLDDIRHLPSEIIEG